VLTATKVDGIYSRDPVTHPDAEFHPRITYQEILERGLAVMDLTAITMLKENRLPLVVFNVGVRGNLVRLMQGETLGTSVTE
jgi:uridylate kinase